MKLFLFLLLLIIVMASCSTYKCYPSKRSKDYAKPHFHRQWMKERSDGYWIVTTVHKFKTTMTVHECKPDSIILANL